MKQIFKRVLQAPSAAFAISALMVGLSAPNAFAAKNENTWMMAMDGYCATARGGEVFQEACRHGDTTQLWDRRDDGTIRPAFSGDCLDSNSNGDVYLLGCNGGDYQKWKSYGGTTKVRNVATHKYLSSRWIRLRTERFFVSDNLILWRFTGP
ncbi:RICIN domain-containing protein [Nocardia sp. CNY236]|uniref:RICIN domain-containing protein n=1 Tax=Nocardia sp. CNY236 TaxID=1169152 RepID=UPI00048FAD10|nr:RICIN domain-containing protein [Nocardia sp. CNY236]